MLAGADGGKDNKVIVVINDSSNYDDDVDKEDNDDKEDNNDDDDVSLSSVSLSKMKFHTNGSAILQNDCVFIPSPFKPGGGVINKPFLSFCSSIFDGDCISSHQFELQKTSTFCLKKQAFH
jgi:hypothetical protein